MEGLPVFDSVEEAVRQTGANASVFFVPAAFVLDAFLETVDAGIKLIIVVPEHIPVNDVMKMRDYALKKGVLALGPTTPGILVPGKGKIGIMPAALFKPGRVAIVSRSGTLSYEFAGILSEAHVGQARWSAWAPIPWSSRTSPTSSGSSKKIRPRTAWSSSVKWAASRKNRLPASLRTACPSLSQPILREADSPQGKKMGHAGAIIRGATGTVEGKKAALRAAGAEVLESPIHVGPWAAQHKLS